nr:WYL domain-containing protein [Kofleriaceae bacterium]
MPSKSKGKAAVGKPTKAARAPKRAGAAAGDGELDDADDHPAKSKDDSAARGDRSKRLLDLVMILLRARSPLTYRDIREQFPSYQTLNAEAGLRAFERDKADLLDLGVPIRYITPDEDDALEDGGYVIDLKRFKMPEVRLTPDEISALVLAASVAHAMPGGAYPKIVDLALKKLAFDLPDLPDTPTEFPRAAASPTVLVHFPERPIRPELPDIYATLEAATRLRKRVTLTYQTAATGMVSRRDVDPYAMLYREGAWLVVGWCHLRGDVRSFRVDRIREAAMAPKPKSPDFERPLDFDIRSYAQRSPWTFVATSSAEPTEEVQLALSADASDVANEDFGATAVKRHDHDRTLITFDCTNPELAVTKVLAGKGAITVRRGERLRARIIEELDAIAARYADVSADASDAAGVADEVADA